MQFIVDLQTAAIERNALLSLVPGLRLVSHLGSGASGHVYGANLVADTSGGASVVVKVFGVPATQAPSTVETARAAERAVMSPVNVKSFGAFSGTRSRTAAAAAAMTRKLSAVVEGDGVEDGAGFSGAGAAGAAAGTGAGVGMRSILEAENERKSLVLVKGILEDLGKIIGPEEVGIVPTLVMSGDRDDLHFIVLNEVGQRIEPHKLTSVLATQVLYVLQAMHNRGLRHRDVRPDNILLVGGKAMLIDFAYCCTEGPSEYSGARHFVSPAVAKHLVSLMSGHGERCYRFTRSDDLHSLIRVCAIHANEALREAVYNVSERLNTVKTSSEAAAQILWDQFFARNPAWNRLRVLVDNVADSDVANYGSIAEALKDLLTCF